MEINTLKMNIYHIDLVFIIKDSHIKVLKHLTKV